MPLILSPQQISHFRDEGTLFPVPVLSPEEVEYFRENILRMEARAALSDEPNLLGEAHLHFPWAYQLATHPRILDVAEDLLGPDVLVHSTTLFHKKPGQGTYASWHQDGYFMDLSEPEFITLWVAFTDSTPENGCVRVLPGTHKLRHIEHGKDNISPQNMLGSGLQVKQEFDLSQARDVVLKPGELSVHHVFTVHGSDPNNSNQSRMGYVIKLLPARVSQSFPHFEVILARGEDRFGHFDLLKSPPEGDFETCFLRHEAFSKDLKARRQNLGRKNG
ncbi:MAG: phytanoyl-CoA dioxygenase family protein [Bacteroidia bacterium]|nr:phytanoyl-CoA dioxygenase family protein [Bacteroidia bacterium]